MMVQHSSGCDTIEDNLKTSHRLAFVNNPFKLVNSGESADGSSTPVSNLSSHESQSLYSKCTTARYKIWVIALVFAFGLIFLGSGYWVGWLIGTRRISSNSHTAETDYMNTISNSTAQGSFNIPPSKLDMHFTVVPTENYHVVSSLDVNAPSDKLPRPSAEHEIKPPIGSPITSTDNSTPPTKPPAGLFDTHENDIRQPFNGLIGSSESTVTTSTPLVTPTGIPMNANVSIDNESTGSITYIPGNLTKIQYNLLLSEGLEARIIAETGKPVQYRSGSSSELNFHIFPDAGATFPDTRWWNEGGWIYVSNSEAKNKSEGGVGAITFDKYGSIVHYRMILENTHMNCGGGRTPWNTWVSCEEVEFTGQIYQVDPIGRRPSERMSIGDSGGRWESFAYDIRDKKQPRFFTTEDHNKGCTRRFTPNVTHWGRDEWSMLHEVGVIDYLYINPNGNRTGGTFEWINDLEVAKNNARAFYPQSEGIDIQDGNMYIVCKNIQQLFVFDLDKMTFYNVSTMSGLFDGGPDQMQRILGGKGGLLYFTEEGGEDAGVHARDEFGRFFTILESPFLLDETTGLSFSPSGRHMYIAYQENGILFDIIREDGLPFDAQSLDVKYHHSVSSRRLNSQWIGM